MRFHQFKPAIPCDRYVECYWYLETDEEAGPVQRIVPDGSVELILHAGTPFAQIRSGTAEAQPRILFTGQITRPVFIAPQSHGRVFGVRFFPAAAAALLQVPLTELTDQVLPLDTISAPLYAELVRILELSEPAVVFDKLTRFFIALLDTRPPAPVANYIVHRIHGNVGNFPIADLAVQCGLSPRQLQRLFSTHVGLTPKTLCRIARFQRVLNLLGHDDHWADIAADAGYYDQSHLLLDFRQFAEETPTFLVSPNTDLAEHFVRRQTMSHFSKTTRA